MDQPNPIERASLNRCAFIRQSTLTLAAAISLPRQASASDDAKDSPAKPKLRIGLVTDLHYAERTPALNRYYRETLAKFAEAANKFREEKTACVIELGDLIEVADSLDAEKGYLRRIVKEFKSIPGHRHYVLGNHCVTALTKPEFLEIVGQRKSYYSFNLAGYHFVILDACFRSDGQPYGRKNFNWTDANIPPAEIEWLRSDLKRTPNKSIVFVHQRLDVEPPLGVRSAAEVRKVLEESGKVLAVLQGHDHKGGHQQLGGIHYCTLAAMVEGSGPENNAYAVMDIMPGDMIRITGFRKQKSYEIGR